MFLADLTPAGAVFLSVGGYAALSVPVLLFPGTRLADFDPRPVLETGRLQPVWQVAVDAGHTANRGIARGQRRARLAGEQAAQVRDRARLAAIALLLVAATHLDSSSAPKKGAL